MNSSKFNHMAECIIIINFITLLKTLSNEMSFVSINGSICLMLDLLDTLGVN
jgi:hypothetical protein